MEVCAEHHRMIGRLDSIDGKLDEMKDDFTDLWRNGPITKMTAQLATLEGKIPDRKPLPAWAYLIIGAAIAFGPDVFSKIVTTVFGGG